MRSNLISSSALLLLLLALISLFVSHGASQPFQTGNSIIQVQVGEPCTMQGSTVYPSITNVYVDSQLVMPNSENGALFQMTSRSSEGNSYNPTQAGDCQGNPSTLSGYSLSWVPWPNQGWVPGMLLGVVPRLFTGSYDYPVCDEGPLSPYYFNFGLALGSGNPIPEQVLLLAMTIQKTNPGAPDLLGIGSEMPSSYWDANLRPYAYYMPENNYTWFEASVGGTNYVLSWANSATFQDNGYGIMVCSDNVQQNPYATCAAFYYGYQTTVAVSFRPVTGYNLVVTTMVGTNYDWTISDMNVYSMYTLNIHGSVDDINVAISQTLPYILTWGTFGGH